MLTPVGDRSMVPVLPGKDTGVLLLGNWADTSLLLLCNHLHPPDHVIRTNFDLWLHTHTGSFRSDVGMNRKPPPPPR